MDTTPKSDFNTKIDYPDDKVEPQKRIEDIFGMFKTVSAVPTGTPINWANQVVYYKSGATKRIYIYDSTNNVWSYSALT